MTAGPDVFRLMYEAVPRKDGFNCPGRVAGALLPSVSQAVRHVTGMRLAGRQSVGCVCALLLWHYELLQLLFIILLLQR